MVTFTINGQEVTVEDGTLILHAARKAGYDIPTFCYYGRLSPLGSCRMCLVEIEGQRKLQPSCVTPVMQDMVVNTETENIISTREAMLEFLLSNHALDCPVCDKGGECELQDMVHRHGPHSGSITEKRNRFHEKDYILSPVIVKNSNRCVQCMRCVRVCSEVVGVNALGAVGRGLHQEETSFGKGQLDCDHCGNCIEVCPVGCFMRLPYRYKSRPWDLTGAETVCSYCGTGCQITVQARDGEVLRVVSKEETGVNNETLCARGRFGFDFTNNPNRLTTPLIKEDGRFRDATWDEALSLIEDRLKGADGPRIGGIASGRLTNEDLYLFQKLMRGVLKSGNIDSDSRWSEGAVERFAAAMDFSRGGTSILEAANADSILIVGSAISDETPVTDYLLRRLSSEKRISIVISSPRRLKLDSSATATLRTVPGGEEGLFIALAKALCESDDGSVKIPDSDERVDRCREVTDILSWKVISDSTGLSEGEMKSAATTLIAGRTVSLMIGTDLLRLGSRIEYLTLLTGLIEAAGREVKLLPLLDRCNQRGAWDMGVAPSLLPGYRSARDDVGRSAVTSKAGHDIPDAGAGCGAMMDAASKGNIDALYVIGEDIVALFPDKKFAREALGKVDFLVVQELFMTETTEMADVVLPGASFAEKEGTFTNQEGRVQRLNKLIGSPGEARPDWQIIADIGKVLDPAFRYRSSREIFEEIGKVSPLYEGIDDNSLNGTGELVKDGGYSLKVPSTLGKGAAAVDMVDSGGHDFPFMLITGNHLLHSGRFSQQSAILMSLLGVGYAEICVEDADTVGVKDGDQIEVEGLHHKMDVKVKVVKGSRKGVIFIPENFDSLPVNRFFKVGEGIPRVKVGRSGRHG
ncbi:MAG: NADH-quinone oxidoreductase subunit NuoG [Deltaproteobacteria bacterium]|nr:NADH-quinone oxidoreductase subunit NuoG [Deltaproteobacteria bacterium]